MNPNTRPLTWHALAASAAVLCAAGLHCEPAEAYVPQRTARRAAAPRADCRLARSVLEGDTSAVSKWLDQGADPDSTDLVLFGRRATMIYDSRRRMTSRVAHYPTSRGVPMLLLALRQHVEIPGTGTYNKKPSARIAVLLLRCGANPNARDDDGKTALEKAIMLRVPIVRQLLDRGADPGAECPGGYTPLAVAAFAGDARAVRELMAHGASAYARHPLLVGSVSRGVAVRRLNAIEFARFVGARPPVLRELERATR